MKGYLPPVDNPSSVSLLVWRIAIKPLDGIKVVDLTSYLAAPTSGRVLAEWGADVVKV